MSFSFSTRRQCLSLGASFLGLAGLVRPAQAAQAVIGSDAIDSPENRALIAQVETYANSFHSLKARFLFSGSGYRPSRGEVWMQRPGRIRLEYAAPMSARVIVNHGVLRYENLRNGEVSYVLASVTALGILLQDRLSLSDGEIRVTKIDRVGASSVQLTLMRVDSPEDGSVRLQVNTRPFALERWRETDTDGNWLELQFSNLAYGGTFDPALFDNADYRALEGNTGGN